MAITLVITSHRYPGLDEDQRYNPGKNFISKINRILYRGWLIVEKPFMKLAKRMTQKDKAREYVG